MYIANPTLNWHDPMVEDDMESIVLPVTFAAFIDWRSLVCCLWSGNNHLEISLNSNCRYLWQKISLYGKMFQSKLWHIAHSHISSGNKQMIFKIPEFVGLFFFEIANDKLCTGLFSSSIKKLVHAIIKHVQRIAIKWNPQIHYIVCATVSELCMEIFNHWMIMVMVAIS